MMMREHWQRNAKKDKTFFLRRHHVVKVGLPLRAPADHNLNLVFLLPICAMSNEHSSH